MIASAHARWLAPLLGGLAFINAVLFLWLVVDQRYYVGNWAGRLLALSACLVLAQAAVWLELRRAARVASPAKVMARAPPDAEQTSVR